MIRLYLAFIFKPTEKEICRKQLLLSFVSLKSGVLILHAKVHRAISKLLQISGLSLRREKLSFQVTFSLDTTFSRQAHILVSIFKSNELSFMAGKLDGLSTKEVLGQLTHKLLTQSTYSSTTQLKINTISSEEG